MSPEWLETALHDLGIASRVRLLSYEVHNLRDVPLDVRPGRRFDTVVIPPRATALFRGEHPARWILLPGDVNFLMVTRASAERITVFNMPVPLPNIRTRW